MSHLPRPDLFWLLNQRQRVLRGRGLTRWEQLRERLPYVDWADVAFFVMMSGCALGSVATAILVVALK